MIEFEGVLAIKYVSDEALRSQSEIKSLETKNGYWQRLRYQLNVSPNGKYVAILFDRYYNCGRINNSVPIYIKYHYHHHFGNIHNSIYKMESK